VQTKKHTEICLAPPRRTHVTHIATQLGLSARTHRLKLRAKPHRYATHQQSAVSSPQSQRKGGRERKKKAARTIQAASVGACKKEAASPSQQLVQRQHQGVESRQVAPACGAWAVASTAAVRVGRGRDTWATHVTRGVMRRSVGVWGANDPNS